MYLMRLATDQPASVNNQIRSGMDGIWERLGFSIVSLLVVSAPDPAPVLFVTAVWRAPKCLSVDAWKAARCDATQNMNLLHHQGKLLLVPCYLSIVWQA